MQLNEIIEENTLPSISRKTRISVQNLEALLARDWSRLKKVQALGFISILEREYQLDLSDMRAECRAYFEAHAPSEKEMGPVITATPEPESRGPSKGLVILVVLLAAVGGYLLFFSPIDKGSEQNITVMTERKNGFFDSVLTTAKGWFGSQEQQSENVLETSDEEVPAVKGAWAEGNGSDKSDSQEKTQEAPPVATDTNTGSEEAASKQQAAVEETDKANPEAEEAQIIQQVKKEQAKAEEIRKKAAEEGTPAPAEEEEPLSDISKMILAATAGASAASEAEDEAMDTQAPSMKQMKKPKTLKDKAMESVRKAEEKATEEEASTTRENENSAGVTASLVVMHPRSKIWVGYTNLRNMKRTTKVTADDLTFDTATGDYILAVGHGQIDFKTANGEKKLNDGKRHFFMIAKGDVREISHEEFQRLNKSKVW